jgi:replication initiation and membrane attachment protein
MVDLNLKPAVVNVLLDYVMKINNKKLTKNFVETIAGQWKRLNIETAEDAMNQAEKEKTSAIELALTKLKSEHDREIQVRDNQIEKLKSQSELELQKKINDKDSEIQKLRNEISNNAKELEIAVSTAVRTVEKERDDLENKLKNLHFFLLKYCF